MELWLRVRRFKIAICVRNFSFGTIQFLQSVRWYLVTVGRGIFEKTMDMWRHATVTRRLSRTSVTSWRILSFVYVSIHTYMCMYVLHIIQQIWKTVLKLKRKIFWALNTAAFTLCFNRGKTILLLFSNFNYFAYFQNHLNLFWKIHIDSLDILTSRFSS